MPCKVGGGCAREMALPTIVLFLSKFKKGHEIISTHGQLKKSLTYAIAQGAMEHHSRLPLETQGGTPLFR